MEPNVPRVLLGISGSSAIVSLLPELVQIRSFVQAYTVIMTASATRLISPTLVGSVLNSAVYTDMFAVPQGLPLHRSLVDQSDVALVVPATLNTLSSLAHAATGNLLTLALTNFPGPVGVVPSINADMGKKPATQRVLRQLREDGVLFPKEENGFAIDLKGTPQDGVSKHGLRKLLVQLATQYREAQQ